MAKTKNMVVEEGTVKFEGKYYPRGTIIPDVPKQVADGLVKNGLCRMAEKDDLESTGNSQVKLEKEDPSAKENSQEKEG